MKKLLVCLLLCLVHFGGQGQTIDYTALDPNDPVGFRGDYIVYDGEKIPLGPKDFFIDGQLDDAAAAGHPYVFNSIQAAVEHLTPGTADEPMTLYIAPYVYWIDDPDDSAVRISENGSVPFGMEINCAGLRFCGLTNNPENVVLACNRGQTHGAIGNFTMFHLEGDDISAQNLTFGNYCNVDLEFPLLPALGRKKRAEAIVQAQLIICNSDRVSARNTRFISRLNLCPFAGAKRAFFKECYFECTDDALCGTGLYLSCGFTFFSSKPFYNTRGTGAVFLDCDVHVKTRGTQYLSKAGGQVVMADCRFSSDTDALHIEWTAADHPFLRCYQYNVTLNGRPYRINGKSPEMTVDMTGEPLLDGYKFQYEGKTYYNTYNLLRGEDGWDPENLGLVVAAAEKETGRNLTGIPVQITVTPSRSQILSGRDTATLVFRTLRFGGYPVEGESTSVTFLGDTNKIAVREYADVIEVAGRNDSDAVAEVCATVRSSLGLEGNAVVTVLPSLLPPPAFVSEPLINLTDSGALKLDYELRLDGYEDRSPISWYRTDSRTGKKYEVSVSRMGVPEREYRLQEGDAGHTISAVIAPQIARSEPGPFVEIEYPGSIVPENISARGFFTDFRNFPTAYQPEIMPGFWTVDSYKPADVSFYAWKADTVRSWFYGEGVDGARGRYGLLEAVKGARLLYTPVEHSSGVMRLEISLSPCKPAGQGFGSATGQYLEIYIKYDPVSLTGYGLRIERTPKNDKAVDFTLMRYEYGAGFPLSESVTSPVFKGLCLVELVFGNESLSARIKRVGPTLSDADKSDMEVRLRAEVKENGFGGFGVLHTGPVGASAVLLNEMAVVNE